MSTIATEVGNALELAVEGVDAVFRIDPLNAARGAELTRQFVRMIQGDLSELRSESIMVEAIGPANYARLTGEHVRLIDPEDEELANYLEWGPSGIVHGERRDAHAMLAKGAIFVRWEAPTPLPDDVAEARDNPIRQELGDRLSLIAFLWQTTLGMEGVRDFIKGGEGSDARLQVLSHFAIRAGRSHTPSSSQVATESSSTGSSAGTSAGASSSGSVLLPALKASGRTTPPRV